MKRILYHPDDCLIPFNNSMKLPVSAQPKESHGYKVTSFNNIITIYIQ